MPELLDRLKTALAERYAIEQEIGAGGMATVYLAEDLKHHRKVAVKVLRTELAVTLGAERFLREIAIAAQLQHPHILMLIDSGEAAGTLYYVMPYVDGGSLRGVLSQGTMKLDDVIPVARQISEALCYAHERGVVHRDIKPENILFNGDYPLVADFGIAKAISTAGQEALTRTGFPLGTVGYMSPEQAAGSSELGPASDVYSLACVVYEMLVGAIPGVWLGDEDSRAGRLGDIAESHRKTLSELPRHIEPAIAGALARRPADRFASPRDFIAALEGKTKAKRRFDDRDVNQIIKTAAESQFINPTTDGNLTVGAIDAIAADVGLSAQRVHDAILKLDAEANLPEPPVTYFSMPSKIEIGTTLPGEISQSEFGELLEEIQVELGEVGRVNETMGKSLSWNSVSFQNSMAGTGRLVHVTVSPKRGETKIRITETVGVQHFVVMVGSMFSGLMLGAAIGKGFFGLPGSEIFPVLFATGFGSYLVGRAVLVRFVKDRYRKLGGLLRKLANASRGAMGEETEDSTNA